MKNIIRILILFSFLFISSVAMADDDITIKDVVAIIQHETGIDTGSILFARHPDKYASMGVAKYSILTVKEIKYEPKQSPNVLITLSLKGQVFEISSPEPVAGTSDYDALESKLSSWLTDEFILVRSPNQANKDVKMTFTKNGLAEGSVVWLKPNGNNVSEPQKLVIKDIGYASGSVRVKLSEVDSDTQTEVSYYRPPNLRSFVSVWIQDTFYLSEPR